MPIIEPGNTQQILQMSNAVEKVFTEQASHHATDHVRNEERIEQDDKKRNEIQEMEEAESANSTDPDGSAPRGRLRVKKKKESAEKDNVEPEIPVPFPEGFQGARLDIRA